MSDEGGSNLRYKLPHYGTPTTSVSRSQRTPVSPGTPHRPIVISDDLTVGTSDEPIWVDDDESEADLSNVAVRGVRKASRLAHIKAEPAKTVGKNQETKGEKSSVAVNGIDGRSALIGAKPTSVETHKPKTTMTPKVMKTKMTPKPKVPTVKTSSIDIAALSKEVDPILEHELEEIALNWRVGAISGTPSAHDVEKGKGKDGPYASYGLPTASLDEDEADRSWHNAISIQKPKARKRQRWYLLMSVTGLLVITGFLIQVLASNVKNKRVEETEPDLTKQQQSIHDVLARITDMSILKNPNTPQYQARRWLLFRDSDFSSSDEDKIIQRYALACFYFATGGNSKWEENNWLSGSECGENPWKGLGCTSDGVVRAISFGTLSQYLIW
jgi:hypothetical protein